MSNYIFRIAKEEWVESVFNKRVYYTAMKRKFENNTKILFVKRGYDGDSLIGYGIIADVLEVGELDDKERAFCLENNWFKKIIFKKMIKFEPAIAIKDTEIARWPQRGALLHGAPISEWQLEDVINLSKVRIVY